MTNSKSEFIIEKAEDLTKNKIETHFSYELQQMWAQYSTKNIILDNGQMICLNCQDEILTKISDYMYKMLTEYIQSEKDLTECYNIRNRYISNTDNINNTSKYVKKLCDIIVNMDRVYKYVHNIAKTLNDNIAKYKDFVFWQKEKITVDQEIIDDWNFIYSIRNKIEHPGDFNTTSFKRIGNNVVMPQVIINNQKYDLLKLAEKSLFSIFILIKATVGSSFLYSKYVVAFTDETRNKLFSEVGYE